MKYGNVTLGRVEAVWNKLGGEDGVGKFLRGELIVSEPTCTWRERDGIIYLTVTSDGTTGPAWIERLEGKGYRLSDYAKSVLRSADFQPTNGAIYEVAILKGMLFEDKNRVTSKIRTEAAELNLDQAHPEIACLIREKFSDEDIEAMGLVWIVTMHEPIKDSVGGPFLLGADRNDGGRRLSAYYGRPDDRWIRAGGSAFVSQVVGPQN
jgi:hypothetical protein